MFWLIVYIIWQENKMLFENIPTIFEVYFL